MFSWLVVDAVGVVVVGVDLLVTVDKSTSTVLDVGLAANVLGVIYVAVVDFISAWNAANAWSSASQGVLLALVVLLFFVLVFYLVKFFVLLSML